MPKATTRKIVAKPAAAKPVAKPVSAKPVAATALANATAIVANAAAPAVAKPTANITRTAKTIAAGAANFGTLSDRDTAYLGFYRRLAATLPGNVVTLAGIVASGQRPPHVGSNKPHDAGVIERLTKAGILATASDGHSFTITALGASTKAA